MVTSSSGDSVPVRARLRLDDLVSQDRAALALRHAVRAAHGERDAPAGAMTHAWLFTGPAGSGRSTAAWAFAAALQCPHGGCGREQCSDCRTVAAGTHPEVRGLATAGLSIKVDEARAIRAWMAEAPPAGRWRVAVVEDADRMTPGAAAALLKVIEEPPPRGVFLLCSPSTHEEDIPVTIRSRCRVLALGTPPVVAVAELLENRYAVAEDTARWAAEVSGGHIGRARVLATDESSRTRRQRALQTATDLTTLQDCFAVAELWLTEAADSVALLSEDFAREKADWAAALGTDAASRRGGAARGARTSAAVLREVEDRQRMESKRTERDALDLMLSDLAGFYRDVLALGAGAEVRLNAPDYAEASAAAARRWGPETALRRLHAVLDTRAALAAQAKPRIALEAMMLALYPS